MMTAIKTLMGKEDVACLYQQFMQLAYDHKIIYFYQLSDDRKTLTICNTYRITRQDDGQISFYTFSFQSDEWVAVRYQDFFYFQIFPIAHQSSYASILTTVIDRMGKDFIRRHGLTYPNPDDNPLWLIKRIARKQLLKRARKLKIETSGWMPTFVKYFLDKTVLKVIMTTSRYISAHKYFGYLVHKTDCLRVWHENRNLLPLLDKMPRSDWQRSDLFSKDTWVKSARPGRKTTILDRGAFKKAGFKSLNTKAEWRVLHKLSSQTLSRFKLPDDLDFISVLVALRLSEKVPVTVINYLLKFNRRSRLTLEAKVTLYRAFIYQCIQLWQTQGFRYLQALIKCLYRSRNGVADEVALYDLFYLADYLRSYDPATITTHFKKNTTLKSLRQRAEAWHEEIVLREIQTQRNDTWLSPIATDPVTVIKQCTITQILNHYHLVKEGKELHHCIASYVRDCREGQYLAYSIVHKNGARATLGVGFDQESRQLYFDQLRSSCNGKAITAIETAATIFINQTLQAALNKTSSHHADPMLQSENSQNYYQ